MLGHQLLSTPLRRALIAGAAAAALIAASTVVVVAKPGAGGGGSGGGSHTGSSFVTYGLASTPPEAAGTVCPGSGAHCTNHASEPAIRASLDGTFFASSENGVTSGTIAWKSTDGGLHYQSLLGPNDASQTQDAGFAPGGGDTDLAVAPVRNGQGNYNVYVSSLTLANVSVSTSTDNGATWTLNPAGALIGGDDREWIAADGPSKVCVSYHDPSESIIVNCSFDAGATFTQVGDAFDTNHLWLTDANSTGNLVIDPRSHVIYQTFSGPVDAAGSVACGGFTCLNVVYVAVSTDGGQTFVDHAVYTNPDQNVAYGHQFTNLSVDAAGNVYSVFSDDHNLYYSWSTDKGSHWSAPKQVNQAPSATALMPWSVAGAAGKIDIVWYGTSYYDGVNAPDGYPDTAAWYVFFAQNLSATSTRGTFSQVAASPINHYGQVCEGGVGCTSGRDLYDDFGVAANPVTGLASIVYSDDQYRNDANNAPASNCTSADNNSSTCDHTSIATQVAGKGIN